MSWISGFKPSTSKAATESEIREAKRQKLEAERAERQLRAKQRADRQKQLQSAIQARREADQAWKELLEIVPDILDGPVTTEDIPNDILEEENVTIKMAFDKANDTDDKGAMDGLKSVQCPFAKDDIEFWFSELEMQLTCCGIKSQWMKKIALQRFLPIEIKQEVKELLTLNEDEAGEEIYYRIKSELLDLFGKKPEDAYTRAKNRVMTGMPSQLGKAIMNDICDKANKLDGCCCSKTVWGMYRETLPVVVRNHVAQLSFNKDTYKQIFTISDQVHSSNQSSQPVRGATVAAVATNTTKGADPEVAAMRQQRPSRGRGGNRN